jgi:hypothetical protein
MLKRLLLLAGLTIAVVTAISAGDFPTPPCYPGCFLAR